LVDDISVKPDPIGITKTEFSQLRDLTFRCQNDAKAIFSTNGDKIWPSPRFGRTPRNECEPIDDIPHILEQLKRSLLNRRIEGGRLFVDYEGAYWKYGFAGRIKKIRFVAWRWKGDPPDPPICEETPEMSVEGKRQTERMDEVFAAQAAGVRSATR
jgi:hypothetical protein